MTNRIAVFTDFDGTMTCGDVGYEMFRKFTDGRTEPTVVKYRRGQINSLQCLSAECEIWNANPPDPREVLQYLDSRKIEKGFFDFLQLLEDRNLKLTVLSEGFDFYIDRILDSHGLGRLERITNRASYSNGLIYPEFPYFKAGCGQCSSCKGYHISSRRKPGIRTIFIGDGHSDIHAAEAADVVFAKSFLREHLAAGGKSYYAYREFSEIIEILVDAIDPPAGCG